MNRRTPQKSFKVFYSKLSDFRRTTWIRQSQSCINKDPFTSKHKCNEHCCVIVKVPDCWTKGLVGAQTDLILANLFCWIHLIRRELWKNSIESFEPPKRNAWHCVEVRSTHQFSFDVCWKFPLKYKETLAGLPLKVTKSFKEIKVFSVSQIITLPVAWNQQLFVYQIRSVWLQDS